MTPDAIESLTIKDFTPDDVYVPLMQKINEEGFLEPIDEEEDLLCYGN